MKITGWIAAFALVFAVGTFALAQRGEDTRSLEGKKAPAFELKTLDGETVALSEHKGDVVVLDFWATWCGPCVVAMPHLQQLANNSELKEQGLHVYAVNLREADDKVKAFIEQNGYTFAVPMDRDGSIAKEYKVQGIPTQVVIGRDGMIKKVFVGDGGKKLDEAAKEALQAKRPSA